MEKITKQKVFAILNDGSTHRKQFSHNSGVQKYKRSPTFHVPFDNGLCRHFQDGTGKLLRYNQQYEQHYCFLQSEEEIAQAESWEVMQGTRVFIRNALSSTMALDVNFTDNTSGNKTCVGLHEEAAKHQQDEQSIAQLIRWGSEVIDDVSYLQNAAYICAVPAMAEKDFDLPTSLAQGLAQSTGKQDLTPFFSLANKTKSLKECTLEEKWEAWSETEIAYNGPQLKGANIIIIDDKYQSGITLQYFGMKLQELGCSEIHGLCMVKTLRDTDNIQVIDV